MKVIITVVSSLLVGLALAAANFSPIQEIQYLLGHKRRIFAALGAVITGYIFFVAAVLISLVELALQYDVQGFVMWSSLFSAATLLAFVGVACVLLAKALLPTVKVAHQSLFAELNQQFNFKEIIESAVQHLADAGRRAHADRPAASDQPDPFMDEKFTEAARRGDRAIERERARERERTRDSIFHEGPAADVLQH